MLTTQRMHTSDEVCRNSACFTQLHPTMLAGKSAPPWTFTTLSCNANASSYNARWSRFLTVFRARVLYVKLGQQCELQLMGVRSLNLPSR